MCMVPMMIKEISCAPPYQVCVCVCVGRGEIVCLFVVCLCGFLFVCLRGLGEEGVV